VRLSRDTLAGLIFLALSLWLLFLTRELPRNPLVPVGPDFYPRIVLVLMAAFSTLLVIADIVAGRRRSSSVPPAPAAAPARARNYTLVGITFAVFAAYVFLLPLLGYRVATFAFVVALQIALERPRTGRRWIVVVAAALATVVVTYLAFESYLFVLLPRGSWTGF
jgi:hypothetical protein